MKPGHRLRFEFPGKQSPAWAFILGLILVLTIGLVDYASGPGVSFAIFYLVPITLVAWYANKWSAVFILITAVGAGLVSDLTAQPMDPSHPLVPGWNAVVRFSVFLFVMARLWTIKRDKRNLEGVVAERTSLLQREIDERLRTEAVLRESEEQFRTLFESAPIGMALYDADGRHLQTNRAYQKMLGCSDEELLALRVAQVIHPKDLSEVERCRQELMAGRQDHYRREHRFVSRDKRTVWVRTEASAIRDPQGRLKFIVSMVEDATDRRAAEQRIRQLASIVDSAHDAIIGTTLDGLIVSWNPAAERLYGYKAEEVRGKSISLLAWLGQSDEPAHILEHIGGEDEVETVHQRKNGERIEVSVTISPISDSAGMACGASVIARDMTERRKLEREIMEISAAERRKIGHDLHDGVGQHLTGTAFKAKFLKETLAAEFPQAALSAQEVVNLINAGIDQVRRLARGLDPIEVESAGLDPALSQLAHTTQTVFRIPCAFHCAQIIPRFELAVSMQLYRIAQEAIHNAIKHGHARSIEIELTCSDTRICLEIADAGSGFSHEDVSHPGLGLRIMKYRARAIGGFLIIDSQINRGTRITCLVPTPQLAEERPAGSTPEPPLTAQLEEESALIRRSTIES